jgi:hypothetical protein
MARCRRSTVTIMGRPLPIGLRRPIDAIANGSN